MPVPPVHHMGMQWVRIVSNNYQRRCIFWQKAWAISGKIWSCSPSLCGHHHSAYKFHFNCLIMGYEVFCSLGNSYLTIITNCVHACTLHRTIDIYRVTACAGCAVWNVGWNELNLLLGTIVRPWLYSMQIPMGVGSGSKRSLFPQYWHSCMHALLAVHFLWSQRQ